MQASDFSNVGDWPILGNKPTNNIIASASGNHVRDDVVGSTNSNAEVSEAKSVTEKPSKTTNQPNAGRTGSPKQPHQSSHSKAVPSQASNATKSSATTTSQSKPQQAHQNPSQSQQVTSNQNAPASQNGTITNGHANQSPNNNNSNNINNRRVPKSKWVPLEIDLPKARGKPRERNNNISSSKRREAENDTEYHEGERDAQSSRRYKAASYRSGNSTSKTRSSASASARTVTSGSVASNNSRTSAPTSGNAKRSGVTRTGAGGIQKPRSNRVVNHHHHQNGDFAAAADFPVDYSLVKKIVTNATAGVDAAPPFLMPYMGTYYYNGVPSYANMDTSTLKEAIRKQV